MQLCACAWIYCWTKKLWKIRTGPLASGPPGHRGPWAAGLLLAKPWVYLLTIWQEEQKQLRTACSRSLFWNFVDFEVTRNNFTCICSNVWQRVFPLWTLQGGRLPLGNDYLGATCLLRERNLSRRNQNTKRALQCSSPIFDKYWLIFPWQMKVQIQAEINRKQFF